LNKIERIMTTISPIGGIGIGLMISFYLERNFALTIGLFIVLISAILLGAIKNITKNKSSNPSQ